ncbi:hypothetical protein MS6204_04604 [Escherichia coli]|nr:hypothetical protein [Escherichia coli]
MAVIDLSQLPAPQIVDVPGFETPACRTQGRIVAASSER